MTRGKITGLFIGTGKGVEKEARAVVAVTMEGFLGDRHSGFSKKADSRDKGFKRGERIRNWRQWSAVSSEETEGIGQALGIDSLEPALLGPNFVISGIADFSCLPPGTVLQFPDAALLVECDNEPCTHAGKAIQQKHSTVSPHRFVKLAYGKRGLVGVVLRPGTINFNDPVEVHMPS